MAYIKKSYLTNSKENGDKDNMIKRIVKKCFIVLGTALAVLLCSIASLLCFSIHWMFKTWTNLTMDELVFHLTSPLEGTNEEMVLDYLNQCAVPVILIFLMLVILLISFSKETKKYSLIICTGIILSLIAVGICLNYTWKNLEVGSYMENQGTYSTFVDDNYVEPTQVELVFPEKKRNLIYIFLESMEVTYTDTINGGGFDFNCIPELTELARENEDFSGDEEKLNGGYAMPGSTWTAGAMFAQTSGIPLTTAAGNDMDTQDSFYANAVTLGDILKEAGYSQSLLIGSGAKFGGREKYFTEHGNFDILDYHYAVDNGWIPEDYKVWWGYEDKKLFEFAKGKLLELSEQDNPFNLTMLTVDTHFEDGFICENCKEEFGDNQYANVMACSSELVKEFVDWVKEQPFYEDTEIVLVGDHPTMDSDFCEDVSGDYIRKVYTCYINSSVGAENNVKREYSTFDIFPTTLAGLGVEIQGQKLGLGTNLFSDVSTLTEQYGIDTEKAELEKKSKLIEELAAFDADSEEFRIRNGQIPETSIIVGDYDFTTGILPVNVTVGDDVKDDMESMLIAVWTNENQEDLQWIQLEAQADGSYAGVISVPNFNYVTGEYHVHAYMVHNSGNQYKLGEAVGIVQ